MKRTILNCVVLLFISMSILSQNVAPIVVQKKGLGKKFMQDNEVLKRKELQNVLLSYPPSAKELKIASTYTIIGAGMMSTGCLVIGVSSLLSSMQDVNALNSGSGDFSDMGYGPAYVGIGLVVLGIPFALLGNSHFIDAIVLYNSQNQTSDNRDISLEFGLTNSGIGVQLRF